MATNSVSQPRIARILRHLALSLVLQRDSGVRGGGEPQFRVQGDMAELPSTGFFLQLIERLPESRLPKGLYSTSSPTVDPKYLPQGHHVCFTILNFDSSVQTLKARES
ncbi:hypothetical protein NL676_014660 [Syzygium grande]|nr:hypothetical protein NL676_014660 [Syzygium grande]